MNNPLTNPFYFLKWKSIQQEKSYIGNWLDDEKCAFHYLNAKQVNIKPAGSSSHWRTSRCTESHWLTWREHQDNRDVFVHVHAKLYNSVSRNECNVILVNIKFLFINFLLSVNQCPISKTLEWVKVIFIWNNWISVWCRGVTVVQL